MENKQSPLPLKTANSIALDFAEEFQKHYPKKPLWVMMDNLKKEIEQYASQSNYQLKEALEKAKAFIESIDDDGEGKTDWKILQEIDSALNPQKA
jgi:hypothetical protein